ncbi:hypothetical protein PybrP1_010110, partial [[Pythium] brassicae (nom. inval.)]
MSRKASYRCTVTHFNGARHSKHNTVCSLPSLTLLTDFWCCPSQRWNYLGVYFCFEEFISGRCAESSSVFYASYLTSLIEAKRWVVGSLGYDWLTPSSLFREISDGEADVRWVMRFTINHDYGWRRAHIYSGHQ